MSPKKEKIDLKIIFFAFISAAYLTLVYLNHTNKSFLFLITIIYTFSYIIYGIAYHLWNKTLNLKNILEYALIGAILIMLAKFLFIN